MVNCPLDRDDIKGLAVLLASALALRILLFPLQGYVNDMSTYQYWFNAAATQGIHPFYTYVLQHAGWIDYPPFNVYIFWAFGSLARAVSSVDPVFFVKLAPVIFDLATSTLIYLFLRRQLTFKRTLIATAFYAFNPAIIFNVAIWGQFDAIYTFFLVLALILALKKKPEAAAVVFSVALLTKPQGIALLPLIALVIFKENGTKRLLTAIAAFATTIFVVILPFEWNGNPVDFLSRIYFGAYSGYQYSSINAFNLWGLFGLWIPDVGLYITGWIMFGVFSVFTLYILHKRFHASGELLAVFVAFLLLFAFFMLPTRIHERYLFPVISMLVLLLPFTKKIRLLYAALTATLFINQAYVLSFLNSGTFIEHNLIANTPQIDWVALSVSIINLALFFYASALLWNEFRGRRMFKTVGPINQTVKRSELGDL
ncbi:MAG: glycosyltransferase family 39 protein [Nitrososphaerota archaeon]|jgi:Gpi18-like mannosyltransferase|nr:glycosyltransferase family 39 protein [Nitrososphaerota archaeon]